MNDKIDAAYEGINLIYFKIKGMEEEFTFLSGERRKGLIARITVETKKAVASPISDKAIRKRFGNVFVDDVLRGAAEILDDVPVEESQWKFLFKRTVDDIVKLYLEQIANYTKLKKLTREDKDSSNPPERRKELCVMIGGTINNLRDIIKIYKKYKREEEFGKW